MYLSLEQCKWYKVPYIEDGGLNNKHRVSHNMWGRVEAPIQARHLRGLHFCKGLLFLFLLDPISNSFPCNISNAHNGFELFIINSLFVIRSS